MKEVVRQLKNIITNKATVEIPLFNKKGIQGITLSKENFHKVTEQYDHSTIAFIDGGNAELIGSNSFSLQIIRISGIVSKNNKFTIEKKEFYLLVTALNNKYIAKNLSTKEIYEFEYNSKELQNGNSLISISTIGNFVRRLEELKMAISLASATELNLIVLDGSLEIKFELEKEIILKLIKTAKDHNILIAGLSKTNNLITNNGNSVSNILLNMNGETWYYHPIAKIDESEFNGDICFVKFHKKSNYVFKLDLLTSDFHKTVSMLLSNCKDPIFLGYPYGLIKADQIARVSNREITHLKTKLIVELGSDWKHIRNLQNTINAHDILDNIS